MVARQLFVFFVIAVFSLGFAGAGFSAGMAGDAQGTVTKIENGKVSFKGASGETMIQPTNSEVLTGLKVGDQVSVKDGKMLKDVGAGSSAPSTGPKY